MTAPAMSLAELPRWTLKGRSLLPPAALTRLTQLLARLGVRNYVLQEFRAQGCGNATLRDARSYLTDAFCRSLAARFSSFSVRHAQ